MRLYICWEIRLSSRFMSIILWFRMIQLVPVQFSLSSCLTLQTHTLQYARLTCPSSTPGVYSNSCPLSQWCNATSSSVVPFSSCLQSFPASEFFPMSQFFASGIRVSVSASVFPMNSQDLFPLEWAGGISWQSKGLSKVFSNMMVQKHQFFSFLYRPTFKSTLDY